MKKIIVSQYRASLAMFRDAMARCPDSLWADEWHKPPFWRIAYHTLFYTDLYLSKAVDAFRPWAKHRDEYEAIEPMMHKGGKMPKDGPPYGRKELLEYHDLLVAGIAERIAGLDLDGESGFPWLSFSKLELQFYNIRHIHHHAGQLSIWLREEAGAEIDWVGRA